MLKICNTFAFLQQQWLHERASVLRYMYIASLVLNSLLIGQILNSMHTSKLVRDHTSPSALRVPVFKIFLLHCHLWLHKAFLFKRGISIFLLMHLCLVW